MPAHSAFGGRRKSLKPNQSLHTRTQLGIAFGINLLEPLHLRFGGGAAQTELSPLVLILILVVGVVILIRPRARTIAPFLATCILVPMDQVLVVGALHFPMLRVLALFGIVRLIRDKIHSKARVFSHGINKIDIAVILFAISTGVAGVLLFQEMGALIFQLGNIYTVFGLYFFLRFLIRDKEDVVTMIRTLAYVAMFIAVIMTWETITGHNPYAWLGGFQSSFYENLMVRDDRFRASGCFGHPILAGTFGAIVLPLFVLLWREGRKDRTVASIGILAATVITLTSKSSTPILAYAAGVFALCMWPLRRQLRLLRWVIVLTIMSLHVVMKAPVWHLISRIDVAGGSSSYHRYMLVDQCIRHFGDWWLIGVKSTADWGWDMWDTANQYVGICDSSGLVPFLLFLAILVYGFKYLGTARKRAENRKEQIFLWSLGSALFANVVAFFGISYWDQTQAVWFGLLAAISAAVVMRTESTKVPVRVSSKAADWAEQFAVPASEVDSDMIETGAQKSPSSHRFFA